MNRFFRSICIASIFLSALPANAQTSKEQPSASIKIPLEEIWSNGMPGTRDIRELEKEQLRITGMALLDPIVLSLVELAARSKRENKEIMSSFVVADTDGMALQAAHAIFVDGVKPSNSFGARTNLALVFFSIPTTSYVELQRVERQGSVIEIQYRFAGRAERFLTTRFALIPLNELPVGTYEVRVVQRPAVKKLNDMYEPIEPPLVIASGDRIVSGSFSFEVGDKRN
jgi:hypothetical protein